ncbi:MAG: hypothetical protein ACSHWN_05590 [Methylophilaceae bacterium]
MTQSQLTGQAVQEIISEQLIAHLNGVHTFLRPLEPISTTFVWMDTLRAVEEFINLPLFAIEDDSLIQEIMELPIIELDLHLSALFEIESKLSKFFDPNVIRRFNLTVLQAKAIGMAFHMHHQEVALEFRTVGTTIQYFQSRRRHMIAMLYSLPKLCKGHKKVTRLDTLNVFMPQIEHSGITLTGLQQQAMLAETFPGYELTLDSQGFSGNYTFDPLDSLFLESERLSITEILQTRPNINRANLEPVNPRKIFSAAEVRNSITLIEEAYNEFELKNSTFSLMAKAVYEFLKYCSEDYMVSISKKNFKQILTKHSLGSKEENYLINRGEDYLQNTNAFAPFIESRGSYISNVSLLQRFMYQWKNVCLYKVKRYQIRSGFIFEDSVKAELTRQGFSVTDVKRINKKEFDVVAVLNGVIHNIQCKNNLIDLTQIETNLKKYVRYNRFLDRYYAKAIAKEVAREQLLRDKLGLQDVRHYVVSRFPLATMNTDIIPFSKLEKFRLLINA